MEDYILKQEERMLYKTRVALQDATEPLPIKLYNTELRLTTERIILITRSKEAVDIQAYDLDSLKIFNNEAQVIKQGRMVIMYFLNCETCLQFPTQRETNAFTDTLMRFLSGKSKFVRSMLKVKKEIEDTGDALEIDIPGIAKTAVKIGLNVAVRISGVQKAGTVSKIFGNVAEQVLTNSPENKETALLTNNEQLELLTKYKQLLDAGAITQEDFDRIKRQIIGG